MASAPSMQLPLFYNDLTPLNSRDHGTWHSRSVDKIKWLAGQHAVPLTVEEFPQAQRHYPIVFSGGATPVPLALMGLNEGINTFVDADGALLDDVYVPAYARRYPFILVQLKPQSEELSLCFDPGSDLIGDFKDGDPLFQDGSPSDRVKDVLRFCQNFEEAGRRTAAFVKELKEADLLIDGEVAITQSGNEDKPFVYRGFQMIDEQRLRKVRGDQLRKWNTNGALALIYAHLLSLDLIRVVFGRQVGQGKGPQVEVQASTK